MAKEITMFSIIDIAIGSYGKKIIATEFIKKGTMVHRFSGKPISFEETKALGDKESFALQTGKNEYIYLNEPECYFNHSCEPNCGLTPALELVALKDVDINEELFYDYSTTMLERHWTMKCSCKTPLCRKVVMDFDQLPLNVQEYYLRRNIVQEFIVKSLEEKTA